MSMMSPKFYVKQKTPSGKVYYPHVEGVTFEIPCKTATEAQRHGIELFKRAVEDYRIINDYKEGEHGTES